MGISKELMWFGLRACLYCGSLLRTPDGLCKVCSENLWESQDFPRELFHQEIHTLKVWTLFQWVPGKQEVLSRLVHALKGAGGAELWERYADEFQRRQIPHKALYSPKPILLIPSPSKKSARDHAVLFAEALAQEGGGTLFNCLSRPSGDGPSQKDKSRTQRGRTTLEWGENITFSEFNERSRGKHVVFVDDIVTTGSTARAAWKTLGKPRDFAVWALAQRSLPCGASKSLI